MIRYKTGNLLVEDAQAIVNTVNCVGVMGRGIALQFKKMFPENFQFYTEACKREEVQPGRMLVFETGQMTNPRYIINFPTKRHWRGKSRLQDIDAGLVALVEEIRSRDIYSIAIPPLGSGLGGLDWTEVKERIEKAMQAVSDRDIIIFEPSTATKDNRVSRSKKVPHMTAGRAALIGLVDRYLRGSLDPFITLLEVHKLMYFMQYAGEQLRLEYKEASYGPYAENLRHVFNAVEGYFLSGYADGGDVPDKQIELVPGALEEAFTFLEGKNDTLERFDRVASLVDGFETPFGLELLSTVHWVSMHKDVQCVDDIVKHTYAWSERKKQFSPRQIKIAYEKLFHDKWINSLEAVPQCV